MPCPVSQSTISSSTFMITWGCGRYQVHISPISTRFFCARGGPPQSLARSGPLAALINLLLDTQHSGFMCPRLIHRSMGLRGHCSSATGTARAELDPRRSSTIFTSLFVRQSVAGTRRRQISPHGVIQSHGHDVVAQSVPTPLGVPLSAMHTAGRRSAQLSSG